VQVTGGETCVCAINERRETYSAGCNRFSHWDRKIYIRLLIFVCSMQSGYFPASCIIDVSDNSKN